MATTTFSVRLDENVKKQLDEFCEKMGISTNAAFNLFATKVVLEKRIPFEIADIASPEHMQLKEQKENDDDYDDRVFYSIDDVMKQIDAMNRPK